MYKVEYYCDGRDCQRVTFDTSSMLTIGSTEGQQLQSLLNYTTVRFNKWRVKHTTINKERLNGTVWGCNR